jgi:Trk-type K+ transport system membrane component
LRHILSPADFLIVGMNQIIMPQHIQHLIAILRINNQAFLLIRIQEPHQRLIKTGLRRMRCGRLLAGSVLYWAFPAQKKELSHRDGFTIVTLGWMTAAFFGSLPFLLSGTIGSFTNAYFETMSGFTTTGAGEMVPHLLHASGKARNLHGHRALRSRVLEKIAPRNSPLTCVEEHWYNALAHAFQHHDRDRRDEGPE